MAAEPDRRAMRVIEDAPASVGAASDNTISWFGDTAVALDKFELNSGGMSIEQLEPNVAARVIGPAESFQPVKGDVPLPNDPAVIAAQEAKRAEVRERVRRHRERKARERGQ